MRARFVETQYAALTQYRGDSSLKSYLTVVVRSWLTDYLVARQGRWRPSAQAVRTGPVAVQLERLTSKLGYSPAEAITRILAGGDQPFTERELWTMFRSLPRRTPMRGKEVSADLASNIADGFATSGDALVQSGETESARNRAFQHLTDAMKKLTPEDRLLVSMRFLDGQSVADIARALGLEQKPLYRRLSRALDVLRSHMRASGLSADTVRDDVLEADL